MTGATPKTRWRYIPENGGFTLLGKRGKSEIFGGWVKHEDYAKRLVEQKNQKETAGALPQCGRAGR